MGRRLAFLAAVVLVGCNATSGDTPPVPPKETGPGSGASAHPGRPQMNPNAVMPTTGSKG